MHQRVVIEDERLQVHQAPHLWGQAVQLIVAQVQIQQVGKVDEQLIGDGVDAVVTQIQHQHVPAVLQVPGDLRQLIVAQILKERWVKRTESQKNPNHGCAMIIYQYRKVIQLKDVIWDTRVLQVVGSGHHRLHKQ